MALTIGQVADAADVNTQTIRYYERRGLFPNPRRTPAGYRQYAPRALAAHDTRGFIKLVVDAGTKKVIGAQILAGEAAR